jgi:threonine/homoserine/homoserine lactone efflux protein
VVIGSLAAMGAVALGMVLAPGPNMIYLLSRTITQGRRAGLVSLTGVAAGFLCYLLATIAGITVIFTAVPQLYTAVRWAGAGYLLWLAWQAVRPGGRAVFSPQPLPPDSPRRLFTMGLVTNLLNPKIAILYVSLLPQFIAPGRGQVLLQSVSLGLTQVVVSLAVNTVIVLSAASIAAWFADRPVWLRVQRYVMATVLGTLAARIVTERSRGVAVAR